jgi:hypothetical protein
LRTERKSVIAARVFRFHTVEAICCSHLQGHPKPPARRGGNSTGRESLLRLKPPFPLMASHLTSSADGTKLWRLGLGHRLCERDL